MEGQGSTHTLLSKLIGARPENRAAIVAIPDSGQRDVLHQLAKGPVWDGNLCSKSGRSDLCHRGWAFAYNGWNFISNEGIAVADALWGIDTFLKS
jgi:hypothetical protein